jgi:Domain of unknown function (DUF4186)
MAAIPKLKITCGSSDCESGRHAYNDPSHTYKVRSGDRVHLEPGVCKSCGAAPVDWARVHRRDISDLEYTLESLKTEYIRWEFWSKSFNKATLDNALREGRAGILAGVGQLLAKSVGPVAEAGWAMRQVPTTDEKLRHIVQYGRHATATCCRACISKWHGVPNVAPLDDRHVNYLSKLLVHYVDSRWPFAD